MKKKFSVSMDEEVYSILEKGAKRFGLNISAYLSQLIMQKDIELNAMRLIGKLTDEQIADEVRKQFKNDVRP
jgi:predicted CopG family antitoxin